jgi:hypothetical protein
MDREVDFEALYTAYSLNVAYRRHLDDEATLEAFCKSAQIPPVETFEEFAKVYDRKYLTKRCLDNHHPDDCLRYFSRHGDPEGFVAAVSLGAQSWDASLEEICTNKRYHLVPLFFSAIPEERDYEYSVKISKFAARDLMMFRCVQVRKLLNVKTCFIEACCIGSVPIVMECLKVRHVVYEVGLLEAIKRNHNFLVSHLFASGAVVTPRVKRELDKK